MTMLTYELTQVAQVVLQPWSNQNADSPELDGGVSDRQWLSITEQLEFKLWLAYAISGMTWNSSSKFPPSSGTQPISGLQLRQCVILANSHIVKTCSSGGAEGSNGFPFYQVLEKILRVKINVTHNPLLKNIFMSALVGLQTGSPIKIEKLAFPSDSMSPSIFKYYVLYSVLAQLIKFEPVNEGHSCPVSFKPAWLSVDEGVLLSLMSYAFVSKNRKTNVASMLEKTAESLPHWPSLHSLYKAIHFVGSRF